MSQELNQTPPAQWSREQMRAAVLADVDTEIREAWAEALKKHGKKLDQDRIDPPLAHALHEGEAKPDPKPKKYTIKQLQHYMNRNELGDLELLIERCGDVYCFDKKAKKWWRFTGGIWSEDAVSELGREVMALGDHYEKGALEQWKVVESPETREERALTKAKELHADLTKKAKALRGSSRRENVIKTATIGSESFAISGEEWDRHPTLLACANGYVDMETGKLYKPDPKLYLRQRSPYPYYGLHTYDPFFDEMVRKILCDRDGLLDYLPKVVGYAATGNLTHKEFYVAYGPEGDNGKSLLFKGFLKAIGTYGATLRTDLLLENKKQINEDPFWIALKDKRMAVASEAKKGSKFSMDKIKLVTGSDGTVVRGLYAEPTELFFPTKLILHSNYIPTAHGGDVAFMKRMRIIPFNAKFTTNPREVDEENHVHLAMDMNAVKQRLEAAGPAVLSYIIRGAKSYLSNLDLTPPSEVLELTKEWAEDQDIIGEFLNICCTSGKHEKNQVKPTYHAFKRYCIEEKEFQPNHVPGFRSFVEDMVRRKGITKDTSSNFHYFRGIRVNQEWEATNE
ncbi:phage/plasmid primase, P4 family [Desulfovibrio mangrovi]|uniref:DNA primase family protein n=1 Tax=Desulfovibrio mangrovi TaxID=2976983 RepID=UPI002247017A|nr:phage/plasmid primase, P4 family [Desulfovibrio mangrovi]UZP67733.1 phage/plasmid primase, P4 family [Desulfovibrio mangrovi]